MLESQNESPMQDDKVSANGGGGWGMAAEAAKSLRAVAGAEAKTSCAYSRGFQISA